MKQITMSEAQYVLSTNLILLPFVRKIIPRYMAIFGYSFKQPKAHIQP
ncbi:hypothetical protein JRG07_01790 [Acinetobacter pittii]|jgi:hypothetical protein|nr:hypothetical protein [Acinetobacter pittii]EXA86114.1 hypothetical protein J508_3338 [Acinetobacter sp. 1289694]EXE92070.1 hypothetical protein J588_1309 [Acinetobacter sp. 1578804]EXS02818.1 hypothetical protein J687_0274 [Acinetobacter sp. 225588]KCY66258.1 hypothetical protein J608_2072 [Acinetobacter baumannii 1288284]MBJ8466319.1 hypothetical protein [Acinetobacter pittii]